LKKKVLYTGTLNLRTWHCNYTQSPYL